MTGWMYGDLESWNDGKLEMKGCIGEWLQDAWLHGEIIDLSPKK